MADSPFLQFYEAFARNQLAGQEEQRRQQMLGAELRSLAMQQQQMQRRQQIEQALYKAAPAMFAQGQPQGPSPQDTASNIYGPTAAAAMGLPGSPGSSIPGQAGSSAAMPSLDRVQDEIWKLESGRSMRGDLTSPAGAIGPMQVMPKTAAGYGVGLPALRDPQTNLAVGRQYVADQYQRFGGDLDAPAAAYNAGPGRAEQFLASGRNPAVLPAETQQYIKTARAVLNMPEEKRDQASQTATTAASILPPMMTGNFSPQQIAAAVNKANPDAPDDVKGAAMLELFHLMGANGKVQFQQAMEIAKLVERRQEFDIRQKEVAASHEATKAYREESLDLRREAADRGRAGDWQLIQTQDGRS